MDLLGEGAVSGLALPFLSSMLDLGGKGREGDDGGIVVYHLCVCVCLRLCRQVDGDNGQEIDRQKEKK